MMEYDRLAERYMDKLLPETRAVTAHDLERVGVPPEMHAKAQEIVAQLTKDGIAPTMDQVMSAFRRQQYAERRRGV